MLRNRTPFADALKAARPVHLRAFLANWNSSSTIASATDCALRRDECLERADSGGIGRLADMLFCDVIVVTVLTTFAVVAFVDVMLAIKTLASRCAAPCVLAIFVVHAGHIVILINKLIINVRFKNIYELIYYK